MDWGSHTEIKNKRKRAHLQASEFDFDKAVELARESGSCSLRRMPATYHFQLICYGEDYEYIYNLYPSTQRIYTDSKHRGPFLRISKPWTVLDVVKAAVKI